ncbi:MAG: glucosaminidase domain-containing protein [Erysipelotrichaceae bacterium]|nr:glucosaminidase domain-containing protein [Erysipelotrichaceae bacterium]
MLKKRVLVTILSCLLIFLVILLFEDDSKTHNMFTKMITISASKSSNYVDNDLQVVEVDTSSEEEEVEDVTNDTEVSEVANTVTNMNNENLVESEVVESQPVIVYDGMTMDELASKLERSLKNELSGKGYLYASYSLEKGVDPYLAVAISLEETGCNWNCSNLVKSCNNVGGMKGTGCGSYGAWPTLDDGIRAFIDNIYRNYVAYGLTTADLMNPKYAENPAWSTNVNNYIARIKNS